MQLEQVNRQSRPVAIAWFGLLAAAGVGLWCFKTTSFVADDSYFYLVIARNLARHGEQTFSNVFPTNGFHPLWGYLLAGYTYVVQAAWPSSLASPSYALPLAIAILAGIGIQCWRMARRLELDPLVVTGLVVGFLLTTGVLYSEALLFFLLLVTMLIEIAGDPQAAERRPVWMGLLAGAIVLTRLDSIFLISLVMLYLVWTSTDKRRAVAACGVCGAIVLLYVLSNIYYFGGAMPISGWMKGSFPNVYLKGLTLRGIQSDLGGYAIVLGWIPLVFAAVVGAISQNITGAQRRVLALLWGGTVLHCLYVALYTRSNTVWPWYYVQAIVLTAVAAGILVRQSFPLVSRTAALLAISALVIAGYADKVHSGRTPAMLVVDFLHENGIRGETIFVSDWPGAVAFFTDNNVLAADMLTFSRKLYQEMREHSNAFEFLLAECERRGKPIRHIIFVGSNWLVWDRDAQELTFNDPREYPKLVPIGVLHARRTDGGEWWCADDVRIWFTTSQQRVNSDDGRDEKPAGKEDRDLSSGAGSAAG